MAIKPADRPKLIGLVVALVGVLGYVLIVMVPKLSAAAAPPSHADAPPSLTAASATVPAGSGTAAAAGDASTSLPDSDEAPVPPPAHRDSFTPPPATGGGIPPAPAQIQVKPVPVVAATAPGIGLNPGLPLVGPAPVAIPAPPVVPPIELKGVILGDPAVAVLNVNGEVVQRQVGDIISAGLKLAKITDAGICIQQGARQVSVTVGHMMPGTLAQSSQAQVPPTGR